MSHSHTEVTEKSKVSVGLLVALLGLVLALAVLASPVAIQMGTMSSKIVETATIQQGMKETAAASLDDIKGKIADLKTSLDQVQKDQKDSSKEIRESMESIKKDQQLTNDRLTSAINDLSGAVKDLRLQIEMSKKK